MKNKRVKCNCCKSRGFILFDIVYYVSQGNEGVAATSNLK